MYFRLWFYHYHFIFWIGYVTQNCIFFCLFFIFYITSLWMATWMAETCSKLFIVLKIISLVCILFVFVCLFLAGQPPVGQGLLIHTHDTPQSVGLLWTSDQLVAETSTWQHTTLTTNIHAPCGIRTHNLSRRAAVDLRLRPRGHWDRHFVCITIIFYTHTHTHIYIYIYILICTPHPILCGW